MKIFTGDQTGLLKEVSLELNAVVKPYTAQSREQEILSMVFADDSENKLLFSTKAGSLMSCTLETGELEVEIDTVCTDIRGLAIADQRIMTCSQSGDLSIYNRKSVEREAASLLKTIKVGTDVRRMRISSDHPNLVALGGKETELSIYDLNEESDKPIFRARNVKHNALNMRVPVFITDVSFVPTNDSKVLAISTAFGQIRLYDTRVRARPQHEIQVFENAITAMAVSPDGNTVICGDTKGFLLGYDVRTQKQIGSYKGVGGGVKSIQFHPTLPLVATVGLDRFARVHDVNTRQIKHNIYLKQKLNCVLFSKELYVKHKGGPEKAPEAEDEYASGEEGDDAIWGSMAVVDEAKRKKGPSSSTAVKRTKQSA